MQKFTFNWSGGDRATYSIGDGAGAVAMAGAHPAVAIDIETRGLGELSWQMTAFSIGTSSHAIVLDPNDPVQRRAIADCIAAARALVLHNSVFDVPILAANGLMRTADIGKVEDTIITARMVNPSDRGGSGLAASCERHLGADYAMWKSSLEQGFKAVTGLSKNQMFSRLGISSPAFVAYSGFDVIMTARLYEALPAALRKRLSDHPFDPSRTADATYLNLREQTVNRLLLARSAAGIEVDLDVVDRLKGDMRLLASQCDLELAAFGVDTDLSRDLMKRDFVRLLDEKGMLPRSHKRLKDGTPSAAKDQLARIDHPLIDKMNLRSQAMKFASDYADKLVSLAGSAPDGRIHPQVSVLIARTGRMSYSDPPLQQYPPSVREMMRFDAPATSMDWSSIEPVIVANLCGETVLLDEFESGGDLYQPVADTAGVVRKDAKTILLAQLYGQGVASLSTRLGIDEDEAKDLVRSVMGGMPRVQQMLRSIRNVGEAHGAVMTISGRVLPLDPDPRSGNTRFFGYRGVNYVVQGSAYDLLAEALKTIHDKGLGDALFAAVHDEVVVATEAAADVERIMTTPPDCLVEAAGRVPVLRTSRSDMGHHWMPKED